MTRREVRGRDLLEAQVLVEAWRVEYNTYPAAFVPWWPYPC